MEHHVSWWTAILNRYLGSYAAALLNALGIHPHDPAHPISDLFAMSLLVVLLGMLFFWWLGRRLSVDRPGATQQVAEWLITNPLGVGIRDCVDQNVHHGARYVPMVGAIGIFILLSNLISLIPGLNSPTANPSGPLAAALITFVYFNAQGARVHGIGKYLAHFSGPGGFIGWILIFPVELISTSARILSLTVRLWANIFASELIYLIILRMLLMPTDYAWGKMPAVGAVIGIFPATLPIAFIGLHIFVAVVQAYVFTILPAVYLGMATAEEH